MKHTILQLNSAATSATQWRQCDQQQNDRRRYRSRPDGCFRRLLALSSRFASRGKRDAANPERSGGTAPIPDSDTPGRKAIRDSFKYLLDENKSYQIEADRHFLSGHLNGLLYPSSFVHTGGPQEIIAELQQLKELDQRHLTAIQHFPDVFKANLTAAGASVGDVDAFERAMRKEISGGALDEVSQAMDLDMKWIDAAIELYQYANQNQSHISGRGASQLEFDSDDVRAHFAYLSEKVDELGDQRDKATATFNNQQKRNRSRMRLNSQDFGQAEVK